MVALPVGAVTAALRRPTPPPSTDRRSAAMSAALMTPLAGSDAAASNALTDLRVPFPN